VILEKGHWQKFWSSWEINSGAILENNRNGGQLRFVTAVCGLERRIRFIA
jgi:hypothetical protein